MKEITKPTLKEKISINNYKDIKLSENEIFEILRWYDGNVYNQKDERIIKAIELLKWCDNSDSIQYEPAKVRNNFFNELAIKFNIPVGRIIKLYIGSGAVLDGTLAKTKIIAIEGIDGTGKTIQIDKLKNKLELLGHKVCVISFPEYESFFGKEIGKMLSGKEDVSADKIDSKSMCLWYAIDRLKSLENYHLSNYDFVLLNRYTLSSAVYQSIRSNNDDLMNWVFELEHTQLGLPVPDLYVVFDIDSKLARENVLKKGHRDYIGSEEDVYEKSDNLLERASEKYRDISRLINNVFILNCMSCDGEMKSIDSINIEVMEGLRKCQLIDTIK